MDWGKRSNDVTANGLADVVGLLIVLIVDCFARQIAELFVVCLIYLIY